MYLCVWVCVYMYMYVCIYIYMYMYIHTHTHNQPKSEKRNRDLIPFLCLFLSNMYSFHTGGFYKATSVI